MNARYARLRAVDGFLATVIVLAVALWIEASSLKPPFDIYPKMVILLAGLLSAACLLQNRFDPAGAATQERGRGLWPFLATIAGILLYIVAIDFVGYFASTLVYLCLFFFIKRLEIDGLAGIHGKGIAVDMALACALTAIVGLVFKFGLKLVFPEALFV